MNRTPHRYANATRIAAHSRAPMPSSLTRWMDRVGIGVAVKPVLQ
jgi:hypothetical protein